MNVEIGMQEINLSNAQSSDYEPSHVNHTLENSETGHKFELPQEHFQYKLSHMIHHTY